MIQLNTALPKAADDASPAEKLRYYRELRMLSQEQLAQQFDQSRHYINNFEKGVNPIYYSDACRFGNILAVDSEVFLDEYLSVENRSVKITDITDLRPCPIDNRIYLWQGDITTLKVEAIVNAANRGMTGCYQPLHGCIDNIIGSKAGIRLRLKSPDRIRNSGRADCRMKVNIQVDLDLKEEYMEFHVRSVTEDISKLAEMIEKRGCILTGIDAQDRIVIIHSEDIVAVHAEKKWSRIYTDKSDVSCRKRLYEREAEASFDRKNPKKP